MNSLKLAFLSVSRKKIQSVIALLSIAISVACGGTLLRLYALSHSRFSSMGAGGNAIIGAKAGGIDILLGSLNSEGEYPGFLPEALFKTLRQQSNVHFEDGAQSQPSYIESIIPVLFFATYKDSQQKDHRVMGTDESFFHRPVAEDSLNFESGEIPTHEGEIVVGNDIAKKDHLKTGDDIRLSPWSSLGTLGNNIPMKVVGILKKSNSTWDRTLFTNLDQAQIALAAQDITRESIWGAHVLNYFLVYLKPGTFAQLENLINKRTVAQVISVEKAKEQLKELTGSGESLGFFIVIFILLLGGLSVMAMLVTRFDAMTVQMAVLRAIGYSKKEITLWLLFEGLILGVIACVLGAILDFIFFPTIRSMLGSALPSSDVISISLFVSAPVWAAAILATILAVVIPLYRVYKQDIHLALRGL